MMKNTISLLFLFVLFVTNGCDLNCISPNGNAVEKKYTVDPFENITIGCSADVILKQTDEEVLEIIVKTAKNIQEMVDVSVINNELIINMEGCIINSEGITVYVMIPKIAGLTIDGSGDFKTEGIFEQSEPIDLKIEGSGDIHLNINADVVTATIDGSGDIKLKGEMQSLKATIDGSGDIHSYGCVMKNADATIDGSGDIEVSVTKNLKVLIDGSGDVKYKGEPKIESNIDGSGDLKKK